MPANAIVNSQQSQIVAAAEASTGHTVGIIGITLLPRLGQSQVIRAALVVDSATTPITVLVDLTFFDAAFEEFDLFGTPQGKGRQAAAM